MRVLSWNLFHGRARPPAGRPLLHEFATTLAGWAWDVALLQEVPPWWPPLLADACGPGTQTAVACTSRNALLPLRRAVASRRPDLARSNGGGANAILVRPPLRIVGHAHRRLRVWPERRVVQAVRLAAADPGDPFDGGWVGNLHAQKGSWDDGPGLLPPLADLALSLERLEAWADGGGRPIGADRPMDAGRTTVVLGGDLNLPRAAVERALPGSWVRIASSGPDHAVGRGARAAAPSERPERGALSDHAPLAVTLRTSSSGG